MPQMGNAEDAGVRWGGEGVRGGERDGREKSFIRSDDRLLVLVAKERGKCGGGTRWGAVAASRAARRFVRAPFRGVLGQLRGAIQHRLAVPPACVHNHEPAMQR